MSAPAVVLTSAYLAASLCVMAFVTRSDERDRRLLLPLLMNAVLSTILLRLVIPGATWITETSATLNHRLEVLITFMLLGIFSLSVELPGFVLNSRYDNNLIVALNDLERAVLSARVDPLGGIRQLEEVLSSKHRDLVQTGVEALAQQCVKEFRRIENVNTSLLDTLQRQLELARNEIDSRSKHPFPALVQILSLSGVAVILGEILATLRR